MPKLRSVVKDNQLQEVPDSEIEYEHLSPNQHLGTHANLVPLQSAVSSGRVFYGARFANQALPVNQREAPLVQLLSDTDPKGRSFDEIIGDEAGNVRATHSGTVHKVEPDQITVKAKDGTEVVHDIYNQFPFNRKTSITSIPLVKTGDSITPGQLLAHSNYTDKQGTLALGTNARVGIVPYKGHSMDDAIVISESMAKRMTSNNLYGHDLEYKRGIKGGKAHYTGLFTHKFVNEQLDKLDDDGVVKKGQVLKSGDPIILATKPRIVSSASAQLGQLSKHMKNARGDASVLWDHDTPGTVLDVARTRSGVKVNVSTDGPAEVGNKLAFRSGGKAVISTIIPDEHMPRTADGKPLEILLNPQSIPSRMNPSLAYEIMLGKVARKTGKPYKLPSVLPKGMPWYDFVQGELNKHGLKDKEEVFDPQMNRKLENPITVGDAHVLVLHHTSASKVSSRGTGSYNCYDDQTEVLTDTGWKFWSAIEASDKLATVKNAELVFEKPLALHVYDYDGEMLGFEGRYLDWLVTPNHNHFVKFHKPGSKFRLMQASELYQRRFYVQQFGMSYAGANPDKFSLPKRSVLRADGRKQWLKGFSCAFDDYAELAGWFVSEGSLAVSGCGYPGKIKIYQCQDVNPENFGRIEALLDRVGLNHHKMTNTAGRVVGVGVHCRVLAEHLASEFGTHALKKHLNQELIFAGTLARKRLLEALLLGDGTAREFFNAGYATPNKLIRYCTSSKALADDVQRLCIGLGSGAVVRTASEAGIMKCPENGKEYSRQKAYYVGISTQRKNALVENYTDRAARHYKQTYKGKVYCATMVTGLLYVRRNGKPMLSGNSDMIPQHGGGESAQSKRLSGLESNALLSSGAYNILREGATLRGTKNDQYWRELRQGYEPKEPGTPFVWEKFKALLQGAGYHARKMGGGRERLQFLTEKDLDAHRPIPVKTGDLVNMQDLTPIRGGLFDPALTGAQAWGSIQLPHQIPSPAAQDVICKLLGLTEKQYRNIIAGEEELPEELRSHKSDRKSA